MLIVFHKGSLIAMLSTSASSIQALSKHLLERSFDKLRMIIHKHLSATGPLLIMLLLAFCGYSCQRKQDINIVLPPYERQMAIECYLQAGQPIQLALTESVSYFDSPELSLIYNATVVVKYKNILDTLKNIVVTDKAHGQGYNYISTDFIVPQDYDNDFFITIKAQDGRTASAQTRLLPPATFKEVKVISYSGYSDVRVSFLDNPATKDYYRVIAFEDSVLTKPTSDVLISDELYGQNEIVIEPQVKYGPNNKVIVELYHIEKAYYDYIESVRNAIVANFDPLTRPSPIKTNITGSLGIFTAVSVKRDSVFIP